MTRLQNNVDNKLDDHFLIMQSRIDSNSQDSDEKMKKQDTKIDKLTKMVEKIMDQIKFSNSLPDKLDPPKYHYPVTAFLDNKKVPLLEGYILQKLLHVVSQT